MKRALPLLLTLLSFACATAPVDLTEERRVVGTENGVRIDALVRGDVLSTQNSIPFTFDVTNERSLPIAVADIIPDTSYDAAEGMVTVSLGSEVPGEQLLPRLVSIGPGEKKSFSGTIRVQIPPKTPDPRGLPIRQTLQFKLNFLGDTQPFRELIGIDQKAVNDKALADRLFPAWLEKNEVVLTNTMPMRWRQPVEIEPARRR